MKFLVLGIGNIMFADEGIGVHLCKLLEKNY
ncbi:hydrogenase expression/formation protein, partial [Campylobacter coli]